MFVTANQIFIFLVSIYAGLASGVIYDIFFVIKKFCGGRVFDVVLDILFFIVFAAIYIFISFLFEFPAFRFYMFFGAQLGLLMYIKSFHILFANAAKKIYNKLNRERRKKGGRRKA